MTNRRGFLEALSGAIGASVAAAATHAAAPNIVKVLARAPEMSVPEPIGSAAEGAGYLPVTADEGAAGYLPVTADGRSFKLAFYNE